ncbi:hypothetical protein CK203_105930 [Vitis vinifera]|uniref:DUF7746 domain-containing protein n=1 Tax=Vitis vinifera TaxID=29760 RepID=A0A438CSU7_VITVI|nr:hypothetical protein CK203_105930 [Vitis vinifera]
MEQNTYTNMFLKTTSDQLNKFEDIIETQDYIKTTFVKKDNKSLFKPFEFSKKFLENLHIDQALIDRISQKVKDSLVVSETPQPSHQRINMVKGEISSEAEYEERNQHTQASYTSGTIYEWNTDGMIEYNILTKLQEMTMGWWDNYLTFEDRNGILKAYRINEENEVVKDEDGQDIEDVVATLIYSISKHFIGDPAKIKDKIVDLLTNLKCPKFHDFRWIKIREQFNGQIPYDKLSYGEIISIVTSEAIKLCNDFKLKQQMKNEQRIYKNEFGSFCSQFGFNQKETKLPSKQ